MLWESRQSMQSVTRVKARGRQRVLRVHTSLACVYESVKSCRHRAPANMWLPTLASRKAVSTRSRLCLVVLSTAAKTGRRRSALAATSSTAEADCCLGATTWTGAHAVPRHRVLAPTTTWCVLESACISLWRRAEELEKAGSNSTPHRRVRRPRTLHYKCRAEQLASRAE